MVLFPNCKINLGLNIIQKRTDGYHDLETVFYPIEINDAVEVIENDETADPVQFSISGRSIDGNPADNLCVKAWNLLKKDFPGLPSALLHLHKTIPTGSGLGGGSADGAFTLKLLDQKFDLKLSKEKLIEYALQLGSDAPFFILNKPCFAIGRGEILEPIEIDLSSYNIVIVCPDIHINTSEAFLSLTMISNSKSIIKIIDNPIDLWKNELKNDFEIPVFKKHVEIKSIKDQLYEQGAIYASMSGSGSSVFGIFEKNKPVNFSFPSSYFIKVLPGKKKQVV